MVQYKGALAFTAVWLLAGSASPPPNPDRPSPAAAQAAALPTSGQAKAAHLAMQREAPPVLAPPSPPPPPPPPTPSEALETGVLIVVSKASQQMFVFQRGEYWDTSAVSTGRRGYETPDGVFPILQKKVRHRSNLYDNAPMPYMQRLTWDGVALHAGNVPGYPASHGCIRLPAEFAKKLYDITRFNSTIVIVTDERVEGEKAALELV